VDLRLIVYMLAQINFTLLLLFLFPQLLISQTWERYENDDMQPNDSIEIYYRNIKKNGFEYLEFKGACYVTSTLTVVSAVIRDAGEMHKWVYNVESAKSDTISDTERYTYIVHKSIGLIFKQRDSYVHSFISQNPNTFEVVIKGISAPDKISRRNKYIRIERGESEWKLIPITKSITKVVFQGYADPGGWISASLLTPLAKSKLWKLPYYSLLGLKDQVKKYKYKGVKYSFLKNF